MEKELERSDVDLSKASSSDMNRAWEEIKDKKR
jgi:hypothetical protein